VIKLTDSIALVGSGVAGLSAPTDANIYLISNGGDAVLVDSGSGIQPGLLLANIKAVGVDPESISTVLHTHSHWDHARGAHALKEALGVELAMHESGHHILSEERFATHLVTKTGFEPPPPVVVDQALADGDTLTVGSLLVTVLGTPGHTDDSLSFLVEGGDRRVLFTGDMVQGEGTLGAVWFDSDLVGYRTSLDKMVQARPDAIMPGHRMFTMANADAMLAKAVRSMTGTIHGFVSDGPPFAPSWWLANYQQEVAERP
jgi:glyoxylase-like metal-dependent hydrolase (beta-lactamase superfamily II)